MKMMTTLLSVMYGLGRWFFSRWCPTDSLDSPNLFPVPSQSHSTTSSPQLCAVVNKPYQKFCWKTTLNHHFWGPSRVHSYWLLANPIHRFFFCSLGLPDICCILNARWKHWAVARCIGFYDWVTGVRTGLKLGWKPSLKGWALAFWHEVLVHDDVFQCHFANAPYW